MNIHSQTALHVAVKQLHTDIISCLLANGADPQIRDDFGLSSVSYCLQALSKSFPSRIVFGKDLTHEYDSMVKVEHCSLGRIVKVFKSENDILYDVKILEGPAMNNFLDDMNMLDYKRTALQKWKDKLNMKSLASSLFRSGSNIQVSGSVLKLGPISQEEQVSKSIRWCCRCLLSGGSSFGDDEEEDDYVEISQVPRTERAKKQVQKGEGYGCKLKVFCSSTWMPDGKRRLLGSLIHSADETQIHIINA